MRKDLVHANPREYRIGKWGRHAVARSPDSRIVLSRATFPACMFFLNASGLRNVCVARDRPRLPWRVPCRHFTGFPVHLDRGFENPSEEARPRMNEREMTLTDASISTADGQSAREALS
jgi:hypothetical protein